MNLPNSNKALAKRKYLLLKLADFSKRHVAVFMVVFGAIGGILLLNDSSAKLAAPTIYLTPDTKTIAQNTEFDVEVRMDSGNDPVNAVQADFTYPADLIDFVSIDGAGSAFTTVAPSTGGSGKVSIARGNIDPVTGDKLVAIVKFKTKATNGNATMAFVTGTALLSSTTNLDILGGLQKTTGGTYTIGSGSNPNPNPNPNPGAKMLTLAPTTQTVAPNTEFTVEVRSDSGTTTVNAVQANFSYPANLVDFVSIDGSGSAYTTEAPSTGGNGEVSIARGNIQPLSGDQLVAKVKFKAKATAGTATMTFTSGTALLSSTTNQDILGGLGATAGGSYTIGGVVTVPPPNPPGPNPNPPGPNPNPVPGKKLYLLPQSNTYARNTEFEVEVRTNSGTTAVNAVQANFTYPANLVDFVSIDAAASAYTTAAPSTGGSGQVSIARGNIQPLSGDQLVAKVKFRTKDTAGTAAMAFNDGTALMSATDNVDILGGLANGTSGGSYIITGTTTPNPPGPNPNPTPKPGDIDGNGSVNFEDLAKLLLKWGTNDAASDIDKNGTVDVYDLSILLSNYGA